MGAIVKQIIGDISQKGLKGKALQDELDKELSPEAILRTKPETQKCKKNY